MGIFDFLRRAPEAQPAGSSPDRTAPRFDGGSHTFTGWDDPALKPFLLGGETNSGAYVNSWSALHNTAVFRCVDLISSSIGMLPLYLCETQPNGQMRRATEHPLYDVLQDQPNSWQTAFEFRKQMQLHLLTHGNAYAQIVRSAGRVVGLIPLHPHCASVLQNPDLSLTYTITTVGGRTMQLPQSEVFHIRDLSDYGVYGVSRVQMAKDAIGLALQTENAAARVFKNGILAGGALTHPGKLGDEGFNNLNESLQAKTGADAAGKWLILEEGMTANRFSQTSQESQQIETRKYQIEEIARAFGVPRPLLMMDDTSWGSGIQTLGQFFVKFGLDPWFVSWEQAIKRSLLTKVERKTYCADFDERELLRGSTTEQIQYVSTALGALGSRPVMTQNEARDYLGLGQSNDPEADSLKAPVAASPVVPAANDNNPTPAKKAA